MFHFKHKRNIDTYSTAIDTYDETSLDNMALISWDVYSFPAYNCNSSKQIMNVLNESKI